MSASAPSGYYRGLVIAGVLTPRWMRWFISIAFSCYIVYEPLVSFAAATALEADSEFQVYELLGGLATATALEADKVGIVSADAIPSNK